MDDADGRHHARSMAHVSSEKKRRATINSGFEALRAAVPGSQTFHSKADVLRRAVNYIRALGPRRRSDVVLPSPPTASPPAPVLLATQHREAP